jgi:hypothetical protein
MIECDVRDSLEQLDREAFGGMPRNTTIHEPDLCILIVISFDVPRDKNCLKNLHPDCLSSRQSPRIH